ncbi:MAG: LLM class flavin-dependent oxidoreductase [Ilumatobacteraceae bacterium]
MQYFANYQFIKQRPSDFARDREAEGWDGVVCADHYWLPTAHVAAPHVWVTLATMAAATSRVIVAPAFANNLFRSPVEFAQACLALQRDSHGRAEAGLGAGWQEEELLATGQKYPAGPHRAAMYREAVEIVSQLLRTGATQFDGAHYTVDVPALGPMTSSPPPLVAAVGGPWTIANVTPLVDRVELKMGRATRGGRMDWDALGSVTVDEVRLLVDAVRSAKPDVAIGMLAFVAVGDDSRVDAMSEKLGPGLFGSFVGEPAQVADSLRELDQLGIDRIHVCEWTPSSYTNLATALWTRS